MTSGKTASWLESSSAYTAGQIANILHDLGINIDGETDTVFTGFCPFHNNTDTPSFAVNKENGTFICFSSACDRRGNLLKLVMEQGHKTIFQAKRLIEKHSGGGGSIVKEIDDIFSKKQEVISFPQAKINEMADAFWGSKAHSYMTGRGFSDKTLAYFEVGYSAAKNLVAIPLHGWDGDPVGVIGRTVEGEKRFKNSKKAPILKTLFNIHRAKRTGERVIIVESSMDAMRIHQAGFPWVVATNGGFFTDAQTQLIDRYFNEVIIMTDNDNPSNYISPVCKHKGCEQLCTGHNPGRALGEKIMNNLKNKRVSWASYDYGIVYPHGAKDAGDMTEQEIQQCINNAVSATEYEFWKHEFPELAVL